MSNTPPAARTCSRSEPATSAPIEIGGTKWPSMTSTCMTRAPASITSSTCAPSREKSAARIDGATRCSRITSMRAKLPQREGAPDRGPSRGVSRPAGRRANRTVSLLLLAVVRGRLLAVLGRLVRRFHVPAVDALAGARRIARAGVGDHVVLVGEHAVEAGPAGDPVHLAVTYQEAIVALATVQRVAVRVTGRGHVTAGQRPERVIAVPAVRCVAAKVGEDQIVAGAAVLGVVALAAGHLVGAWSAIHDVVAVTTVQPVAVAALVRPYALAAVDGVFAGPAVDAVAAASAEQPVGSGVPGDEVPARAAGDLVVAGVPVKPV